MQNPNRSPQKKLMQIVKQFLASMLAAFGFLATISLAQPAAANLELGKPAEFTLKGGETHTFPLSMTAGQFVEAAIDQRGMKAVAVLIAPDNAVVYQADVPDGNRDVEPPSNKVELARKICLASPDGMGRAG